MKRRIDTGFTLLEVLAAVAILGIWFTVLANVAIQGLRAEGENAFCEIKNIEKQTFPKAKRHDPQANI